MSQLAVDAVTGVELAEIPCAGGQGVCDPLNCVLAGNVHAEEQYPMPMTLNVPASAPAPETSAAPAMVMHHLHQVHRNWQSQSKTMQSHCIALQQTGCATGNEAAFTGLASFARSLYCARCSSFRSVMPRSHTSRASAMARTN